LLLLFTRLTNPQHDAIFLFAALHDEKKFPKDQVSIGEIGGG
jgi:hypothetical protein